MMDKYSLKRKILIDIINKNSDDNAILLSLKKEIEGHDFCQDERFMPECKDNVTWRQDFLEEEAQKHIEDGDVNCAYKNLFELIRAENPDLHGSYIHKIHFKNELDKEKHENYYQDGFICEKEKNIIMKIINLIEEYEKNNTIGLPNNVTFKKKSLILTCSKCGGRLIKLMPNGTILHCNKCNKSFKNENETVGDETTTPYNDTNILY